ncbi:hypothetical protein NP233_g12538 [Leucocoprinus birnbaumii]|uniref:RRM domain-containing protein n=1 Tax=Leucocoprinus birnbaumii TaxID=56174 RepID=A0AAD5YJC8_9AGAR|nr:hypothetical protein NP233_g12538 [Leucocoprinus birnbaumii]
MADVDTAIPAESPAEDAQEIMLMKQRVEEMEREAKKLRELQAAAEQATNGSEGGDSNAMETEEDKALIDSRSVYVGNVDYNATPEEIQGHFQSCGTINRVTILCDKFTGHPKGYAYVEFSEPDHIDAALAMDNSLFRGRLIKRSGPTFQGSTEEGDAGEVATEEDIEVDIEAVEGTTRMVVVVAGDEDGDIKRTMFTLPYFVACMIP